MPYTTTQDGTEIYYKDWGNKDAKPVVFSHGWPLSSDDWENQMFFLASKGYRVVAHDRRGHGRSSQPWEGNNMDTYADDLHQVVEKLDLKDVMMVGHSTGGGEVARYVGRYGTTRVTKLVLVSAVAPTLPQSDDNPSGLAPAVFQSFYDALLKDRSSFFLDVPSGPFFGFNRPGVSPIQGKIWSWWQQGMTAGLKAVYDCVTVWVDSDMTEDIRHANIPILILHGTDDQIVPIDAGARRAIKLCKQGTLKEFEGAPHALPQINVDEVNQELLKFLES